MNLLKGISFKLISTLLFALMSVLVRYYGEYMPVGQIVFFRSLFAIVPVLVIYAIRNELRAAVYTRRPLGQLGRGSISVCGMFSNFGALARLPLADATAISFSSPLMTVALAALILKERVGIYRWSAVAVGFIGVLIMLLPQLDVSHVGPAVALGAALATLSAICTAGTVIQTRRLVQTETTPAIVFYFSLICAIAGAVTLPFAWYDATPLEFAGLILIGLLGGLAHIVLTESYRFAQASVVAPFDYVSMIWALLFGFWVFGEVPTAIVLMGAGIVAGAGLFVIWRERQLGLRRAREAEEPGAPH